MKKRIKIAALAAVGALCVTAGAVQMQLAASADNSVLQQYQESVTMEYGASVRYVEPSGEEDATSVSNANGLRFEMQISPEAYKALKVAYNEVTFGILIAPASYEDDIVKLTVDTVFGDESTKQYDWAIWNAESGNYEYEQSDYTRIINVSTTVDEESDLKATLDGNSNIEHYRYYGSITGIQSANLSREFIGVGYVTANGETIFAERNDNVRSVTYVAQRALESKNSGVTDAAKTWLKENYVDPVANEETTYTVQYRINTNVNGGKAIIDTKTFKAKINDSLKDVEADALSGYTCKRSESDSDSIVYANGKSVVVVDCEYANDIKVELQRNDAQAYVYDKSAMFYLTGEKTSFGAVSGIFYNATENAVTISVGGTYGEAAIVDKNGLVVEGRDGANGRLVNAAKPVRTASSTETCNSSSFAKDMIIPGGGLAIVVQNNANSTQVKYDTESNDDIRKFMYNDIIARYGNCVQISVNDTEKTFTEYKSRMIVEEEKTLSFDVKYIGTVTNEQLLENVRAVYDNGTFALSDDVAAEEVTFAVESHNIDLTKDGTYLATISATDNDGATATFVRAIKVNAKDNVTLTIGDSSFNTTSAQIAVNKQAQSTNGFNGVYFRLYTPTYNKDTTSLYCSNGYGAALIIDKDGIVVKAYDAGGDYYTDNQGEAAGKVDVSKTMDKVYLDWYNNYKENGAYLLIAPNDNNTNEGGNNAKTGSRQFLRNLVKTACGQKVVF